MIRLGARISAARGDPLAYPVTHITGCAPGAVPGLTPPPEQSHGKEPGAGPQQLTTFGVPHGSAVVIQSLPHLWAPIIDHRSSGSQKPPLPSKSGSQGLGRTWTGTTWPR